MEINFLEAVKLPEILQGTEALSNAMSTIGQQVYKDIFPIFKPLSTDLSKMPKA